MKQTGIFLGVLLLVVLVLWAVVAKDKSTQFTPPVSPTSSPQTSQINEQGNVTVKVTPRTLSPGNKAEFSVALNTHSVELDYDFAQISQLHDDKGNVYKPIEWRGGKGGHHLSGDLIFPPLTQGTRRVTLIISGIEGVDRSFEWSL